MEKEGTLEGEGACAPVSFWLNGEPVTAMVDPERTLLSYLREEPGLVGVKNGCGKGHCGACTVVVEGRARRACTTKMKMVAGQHVETIEGLARVAAAGTAAPELWLHPLQYAFLVEDAVQCGFCTPGMIMAAKALLDRNPGPTAEEIRNALKGNLCRCTGYRKIIRAVQHAASLLRQGLRYLPVPGAEVPPDVSGVGGSPMGGLPVGGSLAHGSAAAGSPVRKLALEKVLGRPLYTADLPAPGALCGKLVRSRYPHAEILDIYTTAARQVPGVVAVLTAADVPGRRGYGLIVKHQPVLAGDRVRMVGDPVALVLAETEEAAERAAALIRVDYRPLTGVFTPQEALAEGAPLLHERGNLLTTVAYRKGDPEAVLGRDDVVIVEGEYFTPFVEHAYMEPEAALAFPTGDGVEVHCPSQGSFDFQEQIAATLSIPREKCRVVYVPAGGAFGGREEPLGAIQAALGAYVTGRPVRLVLSREESIVMSTKRHAEYLHYRTAATRDGKLLAMDIDILLDTGAYASLGPSVTTRSASFATGPYYVPNVRVRVRAVYTNNPVAGAMRGFGSPQVAFAAESQMERLAHRLGLDPFQIRLQNALRPGLTTATGDSLGPGNAFVATLEKVREAVEKSQLSPPPPGMRRGVGVACAYKNVGLGTGLYEHAGCSMELRPGGRLLVRVGCVDTGQGSDTAMAQLAAAATGIPLEMIDVKASDTHDTPDAGVTTGSRMVFLSGNAVYQTGLRFRQRLEAEQAELSGMVPGQPEALARGAPADRALARGGSVHGKLTSRGGLDWLYEELARRGRRLFVEYDYVPPATQPIPAVVEDPPHDPARQRLHYAYCFTTQAAVVDVEEKTGRVHVRRIIAAGDVGRTLHLRSTEGQIEGGVAMGLGYALYEEFQVKEGQVLSDDLQKLGIPRITQVPEIEVIVVEDPHPEGPLGAKGMSELPVAATAPAIANAIFAATGVSPSRLPIKATDIVP